MPQIKKRRIFIDIGGLTCPKKGSREVLEALHRAVKRHGLEEKIDLIERGCFGLCNLAPNLYVEPDGIWYSKFTVRDASLIVRQHLIKNKPVNRLIHYKLEQAPNENKKVSA